MAEEAARGVEGEGGAGGVLELEGIGGGEAAAACMWRWLKPIGGEEWSGVEWRRRGQRLLAKEEEGLIL